MRTLHYCLLLTIFAGFISSCEKDKDTNPQNDTDPPKNTVDSVGNGKSRVKSVTRSVTYTSGENRTTHFSLAYDASGNLQSISSEYGNSNDYEHYYWSANNLRYEFHAEAAFDMEGSYTRNPEGYVISGELVESLRPDIFGGGPEHVTTNYQCAYNEKNQLVTVNMSATDSRGNSGDAQANYVWENGNLISIEGPGWSSDPDQTIYYEYYDDKAETRDIGLRHLPFTHLVKVGSLSGGGGGSVGRTSHLRDELTTSRVPFLSKNLLKKVTYSSSLPTEEYDYDFDSKGRVIRETLTTQWSATEYNYEYFD